MFTKQKKPSQNLDQPTAWTVFILLFSLLAILGGLPLLFPSIFPEISDDTAQILQWGDDALCAIFLFDFIVKMVLAKNKAQYFWRDGWVDLISSIPAALVAFMLGGANDIVYQRAMRILRIVRILRSVKGIGEVRSILKKKPAVGIFCIISIATFMLVFIGAILVLWCEGKGAEESQIKTAPDALWWAIVTVTTVGYGDFYPSTFWGRSIAVILMICGILLFGSLTACITTAFNPALNSKKHADKAKHADEAQTPVARIKKMETDLRALRELLEKRES